MPTNVGKIVASFYDQLALIMLYMEGSTFQQFQKIRKVELLELPVFG